ncbi:MAG: peptide ABC transporter substrate-binding protein [Planctomycetota bacterium]|nr:MAG: peptide ABC transporter substrate-binding protein [Planctomycetota bacterium]REJ87115.1 MAG: peptide ABC transporter substrate-binding protein [Planctomycetota bacterium]
MQAIGRKLFPYLAAILLLLAAYFAVAGERRAPADFTFVNGTEIKSIDPAISTGQPEGRIIRALFEGLVNWDPRDLSSTPGVAARWEMSEDSRRITFHLRDDALWSDGTPVTADDFVYSYRRLLDPLTAAQYAYQLYYVVGAEKYNRGQVAVGDRVEIERFDPPSGAPPHARGELLRGTLLEYAEAFVDDPAAGKTELSDDEQRERLRRRVRMYTIEIDGEARRFKTGVAAFRDEPEFDAYEPVKQVLVDFDTVGIRAPDDRTLIFELNNPAPYFVSLTGFYPLYPVHRETVERFGSPDWMRPENLVGNGPYRLEERAFRDYIRLAKSETYWNAENVKLDVIDALAVESNVTALNMYENRQVDWTPVVPTVILPELKKQDRDDLRVAPYLTITYFRFNVTRSPLTDARVRRALSLAIDRPEIVDKIMRGGRTAATSFVPIGIEGYESPDCCQHDPEEARRLLAKAGFPGGKGMRKLTLLHNASEDAEKLCQAVQFQWHDTLGVEVELVRQEWGTYQEKVRNLEYDVAIAGWIGDYVDPNTFLDMFVTGGGNNNTGWSHAEFDAIIKERAPRERDPEKRLALMRQAEEILLAEMPVVPLYFPERNYLVRTYVKGLHNNILDVHPLHDLWIDEAERERQTAPRRKR